MKASGKHSPAGGENNKKEPLCQAVHEESGYGNTPLPVVIDSASQN